MTPAEQAVLLAYQQEQQRAAAQNQQDQGGLLDALGKLALGAAGVSAGWYLGGKALKALGSKSVAPSKVAPSAAEVRRAAGTVPADVTRQQRGIELTRLARAERPQGIVQADLSRLAGQTTELPASYYQRTPSTFKEFSQDPARALLTDPELLKYVEAEEAAVVMREPAMRAEQSRQQAQVRRALSAEAQGIIDATRLEANTAQAAAQKDFANQYLRNQGYVAADTLVDQHQGRIVTQVDHFANAVNSAEDQATGRVKAAIQRNEDANLAAVEMAEDAVDSQLARMAQQSPEIASAVEVDAAINQVASQLEDGLPVDQAELDLAKIQEYQVSRESQIASSIARGRGPMRAARNVQITPSQQAALERQLPAYSAEDVMSQPGLQSLDVPGSAVRQEPQAVRPGVMIPPASKTSYRGITGRPDLGIYGEVPSGRQGYLNFGPGSVEAQGQIINAGEERKVTTPRAFIPGLDVPKMETPEGFVYTEEALQRPTAGSPKTGLENMSDEVVGMMSMAGDRSQKEAALAELTRRDPEYRQQRIESARAGETVRRILGSGKPNAQALVNEYLGQLRQQQS